MDLKRAIRRAVDSGKVVIGTERSIKLALNGSPKAIVIAANCPTESKGDFVKFCEISKIKIITFPGTSVELGTVCGKPYPISAMSVLEAGNSELLSE